MKFIKRGYVGKRERPVRIMCIGTKIKAPHMYTHIPRKNGLIFRMLCDECAVQHRKEWNKEFCRNYWIKNQNKMRAQRLKKKYENF